MSTAEQLKITTEVHPESGERVAPPLCAKAALLVNKALFTSDGMMPVITQMREGWLL